MVWHLGIWGTVTAGTTDGCLTLLHCIQVAVGACVVVVVRTPRRCVRTGSCGEHQCQRGERSTSEHSHVDLPPVSPGKGERGFQRPVFWAGTASGHRGSRC